MNNPSKVVGDFFEIKVASIFDLVRIDPESTGFFPDLVSKDGSFFMEVKASHKNNGGVIKGNQLKRFCRTINRRRFYAFPYHDVSHISQNYRTVEELIEALEMISLYIFPVSIVRAHYDHMPHKPYTANNDFVQLSEPRASRIFGFDEEEWERLSLKPSQYQQVEPPLHERVHILTRQGHLEKELVSSFRSEFV